MNNERKQTNLSVNTTATKKKTSRKFITIELNNERPVYRASAKQRMYFVV